MAGTHGFGAQFWLHNGSTLVQVADVLSVTPPSATVETIDTTTHGSTGAIREFIAGLIDSGEGSVRINWNPGSASDTLLEAQLAARTPRAFQIVVPTAGGGTRTYSGTCLVTGYEKDDVVIDDKLTAVLTIKASGAITAA